MAGKLPGSRRHGAQRRLMDAAALQRQGQLDAAAKLCGQILKRDQRDFDAIHLLGVIEGQRHNTKEAAEFLGRAVQIFPGDATALMNYGNALFELGRFEDALANHDLSLRLNPAGVSAHYNRGVALAALQRPAEALESYARVVATRPAHADAHYGMGNSLASLLRVDEAIAAFDRAIALQPGRANFHLNKAFACLLAGDLAGGWPLYEWRWETAAVAPLWRAFPQPLWRGDTPLAGKTILVHAEQGFGDTLHFCRYATLVAERGATVLLEAQPELANLMRTVKGVAKVIPRGDELDAFDLHCPLLSLPLAFGTTLQSIPAAVPYLHPDPARAARWRDILGPRARPRVGVVWSGSGSIELDQRSLTFERFGDALPGGVDYVCLQKEVRPSDAPALAARADVRMIGDKLGDFADTAALVSLLDVVVSSDTASAHLTGALGKPLWLLLAYDPTWRWLIGRADSPWYPTAHLFRQPALGDWATPLQALRDSLSKRFDLAP